jgi:antitoxin component of MazEF toxin-antitoxin module
MRARILKWGDGLALRLPREIAERANLSEGASVDLVVVGGALKITPARRKFGRKQFRLCDLLANESRAPAVGWGKAEGNEAC